MRTTAAGALNKLLLAAVFITGSTIACNSGSPAPASNPPSDSTVGTSTDSGSSGGGGNVTATAPTTGSGTGLYVSGDPNCQSAAACPAAHPGLQIVALQKGALTGTTNETSNWNFVAYDLNSPTRQIAILLSNVPADAFSDPTLELGTVTSAVVVNWTPTTATSGSIGLILRDWDRCLVTETADNTVCIHTEFNAKYDTKEPAQPYIISQQPGTGITCPNSNFLSGLIGQAKPPGC